MSNHFSDPLKGIEGHSVSFSKSIVGTFLLTCVVAGGCSTPRSLSDITAMFRNSPETDPDDPVLSRAGELSAEFKRAQKGLDDPEGTMLRFARVKEDVGQYAEAKQRYREILKSNPKCIAARLGIARIEYDTGRVQQSERVLVDAAKRHPESRDVWIELGRLYVQEENWNSAVESFEQAARLDPNDEIARYEMGIALARSDQFKAAIPHLEFAVGKSAALYNIGYILHESDRSDEAAEWFQRSLASHPDARTRAEAEKMLVQLGRPVGGSDTMVASGANSATKPALTDDGYVNVGSSEPGRHVAGNSAVQRPDVAQSRDTSAHQDSQYRPISRSLSGPVLKPETGVAKYDFSSTPQWSGPSGDSSSAETSSPSTVTPGQWRGKR